MLTDDRPPPEYYSNRADAAANYHQPPRADAGSSGSSMQPTGRQPRPGQGSGTGAGVGVLDALRKGMFGDYGSSSGVTRRAALTAGMRGGEEAEVVGPPAGAGGAAVAGVLQGHYGQGGAWLEQQGPGPLREAEWAEDQWWQQAYYWCRPQNTRPDVAVV